MQVMAKIALPVESDNRAVKDGSIGKLIQSAAERWKPEAMCFGGVEWKRTAFIVFDMPGLSGMIPFAEPFFQGMNTDAVIIPIMNADDMQKGSASSADEQSIPRR
jgi:hypothetical protein